MTNGVFEPIATQDQGSTSADECTTRSLTVGQKVIVEMVRQAALEVHGVLRVSRGGAAWANWLAGSPVKVRLNDGRVRVKVWIVARPAQPLVPLAAQVRQTIATTVHRLLGLEPDDVVVVVDGVGSTGG